MSLVATRLQNWRIENPELDRNMTRPCEYGALDFSLSKPTPRPQSLTPICVTVRLRLLVTRYKYPLSITTAMYRLAMSVRVLSLTMKIRPHW